MAKLNTGLRHCVFNHTSHMRLLLDRIKKSHEKNPLLFFLQELMDLIGYVSKPYKMKNPIPG